MDFKKLSDFIDYLETCQVCSNKRTIEVLLNSKSKNMYFVDYKINVDEDIIITSKVIDPQTGISDFINIKINHKKDFVIKCNNKVFDKDKCYIEIYSECYKCEPEEYHITDVKLQLANSINFDMQLSSESFIYNNYMFQYIYWSKKLVVYYLAKSIFQIENYDKSKLNKENFNKIISAQLLN